MHLQHDPLQDQGYQGTSFVKRRGQYTGKEDADDSGKGADMTGGIIIFSFTRTGTELNRQLRMRLSQENKRCCGYAPEKFSGEGIEPVSGEIRQIIGKNWGKPLTSRQTMSSLHRKWRKIIKNTTITCCITRINNIL